MKRLKSEEGFTLMEISISVAMLAFISVVVIKLFLAASNVNVKATEVDMATIIMSNELELLCDKASLDLLPEDYEFDGEKIVKHAYFDDSFKLATSGKYEMTISLEKEKNNLYRVGCSFEKGDKEIMKLNTYKHFKFPAKKVGASND